MTDEELLRDVDAAFASTARGLEPWDDPHPDRQPATEEYSRVTNPARFRLIGARADAWVAALTNRALATVNHEVRWTAPPQIDVTRSVRVVPTAAGALPMVIARSQIADITDAGVVLGVGHPTVLVNAFPDCGCDACDSGSQNELDHLDRHVCSIVQGRFRHLSRTTRPAGPLGVFTRRVGSNSPIDERITVLDPDHWTAQTAPRTDVRAALDDPNGWDDLHGAPWS